MADFLYGCGISYEYDFCHIFVIHVCDTNSSTLVILRGSADIKGP